MIEVIVTGVIARDMSAVGRKEIKYLINKQMI